MSLDASVPKALYQANIDLALRIAALLQESGTQWFDLFAAEANARLDEAAAPGGPFAHGFPAEWAAMLPPDLALKWSRLNPARWHALLTRAVANQTRFAEGLQAALLQWKAACSDAFETAVADVLPDAAGDLSALPGWQAMTDSMQEFMARWMPSIEVSLTGSSDHASEPENAAAAPQSAGATATPKSAARKTAARKAAPKKAAAKKTATRKAVAKQAAAKESAAGKTSSRSTTVPQGDAARPPKRTKAATKAPRPVPAAVTRSRRSDKPES